MSNEQFEMLINLMGNAADGTFWLVVMFMSVKVMELILITGCVLATIYAAYNLLSQSNNTPTELQLMAIYREVTGSVCNYSYSTSDQALVLKEIVKLKASGGHP